MIKGPFNLLYDTNILLTGNGLVLNVNQLSYDRSPEYDVIRPSRD